MKKTTSAILLWDIVVHVQSVSLPKYGFAQLRQGTGGRAVQSLDSRHLWLPTIILEHDLLTSVCTRLERCIGIIASLDRLLTNIGKQRLFCIWKPSENNLFQWLSRNNRTDCDCDIENHESLTMVVICRPLLVPKADVKQSNQRFWQIECFSKVS